MASYCYDGKNYYGDTALINAVGRILPEFSIRHMGFGEFVAEDGRGNEIEFDRMRGRKFPGQSGRSHQLYDNKDGKLVKKLIKTAKAKGLADRCSRPMSRSSSR